jgi:allantoicase
MAEGWRWERERGEQGSDWVRVVLGRPLENRKLEVMRRD